MEKKKIKELLGRMTLEEKAGLCCGKDFWHTAGVERLGIPSVLMTDGPHGIRLVATDRGLDESLPATCFPTASALACSWDPELCFQVGRAIGVQARALGIGLVLGPGMNMKRSPLCGRNFEYFSEDPLLAGRLAGGMVKGIQSRGVGACVKHYAVNNQETDRMRINAVVDERSLREIYLAAFGLVVREAAPWAVMAAYNRVNGEYATQHRELLRGILLSEWGFTGIIVSDWAAVDDRVKALDAGLHLQMPGDGGVSAKKIIEAVRRGTIKAEQLDAICERLLEFVFWVAANGRDAVPADRAAQEVPADRAAQEAASAGKPGRAITAVDLEAHHALAGRAAAESMVLLQNRGNVLPLLPGKYKNLLVVGGFAKTPRFQGAGSSRINPTRTDIPYDEICKAAGGRFAVTYARGYADGDAPDAALIAEACGMAAKADIALVFAGLPDLYESEGYDRLHLDLPPAHNKLIEELAAVQPRVAVILQNGSPVAMPWLERVPAVLETWLGGQAVGGAIADVLFGTVNPCGKLAETFARRLPDTPAYVNWPGQDSTVRYGEGIFIGYRYYDKKKIEPMFCFGHGLSYTQFSYDDLQLSRPVMNADESLEVRCRVKNTGPVRGKEVVQLYVGPQTPEHHAAVRQLKAFRKLELEPGREQNVSFTLTAEDFAGFNTADRLWTAPAGTYALSLGSSSRDIRLSAAVEFTGQKRKPPRLTRYSTFREWLAHPRGKELVKPMIDNMMYVLGIDGDSATRQQREFVENMAADVPVCKTIQFSRGQISEQTIADLIKRAEES
jgi:beta-glucosidase